jgi:hypothetical protein
MGISVALYQSVSCHCEKVSTSLYNSTIRKGIDLPNGETSKRGIVSEGLNAHGLGRNHLHDSGVAGLDEFLAQS